MRKFLTCALCFVPTYAGALTLYYTPDYTPDGRGCPGLYLSPATTGCPDESQRVVKLNVSNRADASFTGYKIGDVDFIDSAGNVKDTAVTTLSAALLADGEKISGYECNPDIYGSNKAVQKNDNGTCVVENSDENSGVEYIRGDGAPVPPSNVSCWVNGKNYCWWNVKVVFHDKPTSVTNMTVSDGNDGLVLKCDHGSGCTVHIQSQKTCCTGDTTTCNTGAGSLCSHIRTPHSTDYDFRGYFNSDSQSIVVTSDDTTNTAFSNFFPKNLNNPTISVTGHTVVVMDTQEVPIICQGGEWVERPDGSRYCNGRQTTAEYTVNVYGGWARKCTDATTTNPSTCILTIGNNWNQSNGLKKGNVRYDTGCADGFSVTNPGTYNPRCEKQSGTLTLNYTFQDQYGFAVSGCSVPGGNSCEIQSTYYFGGFCSGASYTLKYLETANGLHRPNGSVTCSNNVFGDCSDGVCNIIGYVCRDSCNSGDSIANGKCVSAYRAGGHIAGSGEVIANIFDECNQIICDDGYKLTETQSGLECVADGDGSDGGKGSDWLTIKEP